MQKLEKLIQNKEGALFRSDNSRILKDELSLRGKIRSLVIENPCFEISDEIDFMAERGSMFIPEDANAYVASDFSGDTQHLRKSENDVEKFYSVYAVQFYKVRDEYENKK
jgi:hypothetical protein